MKATAETLTPEQTTFLLRRRVARLATADATGEPHVDPDGFAYAPGTVYIALA